jgi:hypothetical protein
MDPLSAEKANDKMQDNDKAKQEELTGNGLEKGDPSRVGLDRVAAEDLVPQGGATQAVFLAKLAL